MVTLNPEPAPGYATRLGATLPGTMVLVRGAAAAGSRRPQRGAQSGVIPEPGRPGPAARGGWRGPTAEERSEPPGPQRPGGRRHLGPLRPAAPRGRGRHSSLALSTNPRPPRPLPTPPRQAIPAGARQPPPTGTPPAPRGWASPPPRPSPQPDSPREYRDLGDSRSRSALSNEMKSEGIAARPSPARGQREGGSGGGGGTSSPGPRAPNRGRQARAAAAASSSRAVTSTEPRTEETASGWRGNSTETNFRQARRGVQGGEREGESQRVRFVLLLSEN